MTKVKVFSLNANGKIEFTKEQLEELLNNTYREGYEEGNKQTFTWTSPYLSDHITCTNSTDKGTQTTSLDFSKNI